MVLKIAFLFLMAVFWSFSFKNCLKGKNLKTFDPYEILGISMDANDKSIRKAFRKLARQFHPDKNPGDPTANKKFVLVNKAF